ncbi:MAG: MerR family transcriptional regulator [Acidimicrobiia bacterium]|nr:MerR family transcriptional regulator [Acidimicrobiia bacterium]
MTDEAVYVISVAARLTGVHPQTLRIYEQRGLLSPHRTPGGTRRYSDEDILRMKLIQELTSAGVNLEGVKQILRLRGEVDRLDHQVKRMRRLLADAETRVAGLKGEATRAVEEMRRDLPDVVRPSFDQLLEE